VEERSLSCRASISIVASGEETAGVACGWEGVGRTPDQLPVRVRAPVSPAGSAAAIASDTSRIVPQRLHRTFRILFRSFSSGIEYFAWQR
jgi:hypothetical protein